MFDKCLLCPSNHTVMFSWTVNLNLFLNCWWYLFRDMIFPWIFESPCNGNDISSMLISYLHFIIRSKINWYLYDRTNRYYFSLHAYCSYCSCYDNNILNSCNQLEMLIDNIFYLKYICASLLRCSFSVVHFNLSVKRCACHPVSISWSDFAVNFRNHL